MATHDHQDKARDMPQIDRPEPGFFRRRFVRGGPWVYYRIEYGPAPHAPDRSPQWLVWINGVEHGPMSPCPDKAGVMEIWHSCQRITEAEYILGAGRCLDAQMTRPEMPEADHRRPADTKRIPLMELFK